MASKSALLRGLLREFRYLGKKTVNENVKFSWRSIPVYTEVKDAFIKTKRSTNKDEINDRIFQGQLYFNYLQAARKEQELSEKYKGVGERPIDEIAANVGLKIPERYQDKTDKNYPET